MKSIPLKKWLLFFAIVLMKNAYGALTEELYIGAGGVFIGNGLRGIAAMLTTQYPHMPFWGKQENKDTAVKPQIAPIPTPQVQTKSTKKSSHEETLVEKVNRTMFKVKMYTLDVISVGLGAFLIYQGINSTTTPPTATNNPVK